MIGTQRTGLPAATALFLALAATAPTASAFVAGGGKDAAKNNDCLIVLEGIDDADVTVQGRKNVVTCEDCDPTCDLDGVASANGTCTFNLGVNLNQPGVGTCEPAVLKKAKASKKAVKAGLVVPALPLDASSVTGPINPVVVSTRKKGKKTGKLKVVLKAKNAEKPKRKDKDIFLFLCQPRPAGEECPSLTTTTTSTSTSTTTIPPGCAAPGSADPAFVTFTTGIGTSTCGPVGLGTPPDPPLAGQVDDENGTMISPLGLGCLYIGGGAATVAAGATPDSAPTQFRVDYVCDSGDTLSLGGSAASGATDCSLAPGPEKVCVNGHPGLDGNGACNEDADCAPLCSNNTCVNGAPGTDGLGACTSSQNCGAGTEILSCLPKPNCFFGPPLPIVGSPPQLSTCVLNVFEEDGGGTATVSTGETTVRVPLRSDVYFTGNGIEPCPVCDGGTCRGGDRDGMSCTPVGLQGTSQDCPPDSFTFLAPLDVSLAPLTTESSTIPTDGSISPDGLVCPGQLFEGFYGNRQVRRIVQQGARPTGGLAFTPRDATLSSAFCIPATGNVLIDGAASLPGPGATSLGGQVVLNPNVP
jgi:hypothetical protein